MADIDGLPFHRKYRPNSLSKYIGNAKLKQTVLKALNTGKRPQTMLLYGDSGCGKAQPLDSKVLTVDGYKAMGDIQVGDRVFTGMGNTGFVTGVYPQGKRPIYKISLDDGTSINVSDEHLNCVRYDNVYEMHIHTTNELLKLNKDLYMDNVSIPWASQEVHIPPYIIGVFLACGTYNGSWKLSIDNSDIINSVNSRLSRYGLYIDDSGSLVEKNVESNRQVIFIYNGNTYDGHDNLRERLVSEGYPEFDNGFLESLASNRVTEYPDISCNLSMEIHSPYGVSWFKSELMNLQLHTGHIPAQYLYNSEAIRESLMNAIVDILGVDMGEYYIVSFKSDILSEDFSTLVRSLGIKDMVSGLEHKLFAPVDVPLCATDYTEYTEYDILRKVISIEYIGDMECQCIMVDHPDHTYVSDGLIPTHNTTIARIISKEYNCLNRDPEKGACGVCPNCIQMDEYIATGDTSLLGTVKEVDMGKDSGKSALDAVLEDVALPAFGDEWKIYIFDEVQKAGEAAQTRLLKITEEPPENVLFMFCTTNPEKLLDTLKNRCQIRGHITKPSLEELRGLLNRVCEVESIDKDRRGLDLIVNRSEFTIRTSLQNLWQVAMEEGNATYNAVSKVFEEVSSQQIIKFFRCLKKRDIFGYVTLISEVKSKMELSAYLTELRNFTVRGVYIANGLSVDGVSEGELITYRDLFGDLGVVETGALMDRLLNMNTNNLELDFLMLGYRGLITNDGNDKSTDLFASSVPEIDGEVGMEQLNATHVLKEKEKQDYETGVKNAEKYSESVGLNELFSMGAVAIDN